MYWEYVRTFRGRKKLDGKVLIKIDCLLMPIK